MCRPTGRDHKSAPRLHDASAAPSAEFKLRVDVCDVETNGRGHGVMPPSHCVWRGLNKSLAYLECAKGLGSLGDGSPQLLPWYSVPQWCPKGKAERRNPPEAETFLLMNA